MQDIFVEKALNIQVIQGIARVDFARLQSIDPQTKKMQLAPSVRLAMPVESLIDLAQQLNQLKAAVDSEIKKQQSQKTSTV